MLSAVSLTSIVAVTFESVLAVGEVILELIVLTVVGTTVLITSFDVLDTAVAGVHAASARMLIAIFRLKMLFRFISFLHLYTVPHKNVNLKFRIWLAKQSKILLTKVRNGKDEMEYIYSML